MSIKPYVLTLAVILAVGGLAEAKGPRGSKKHQKRGGYSGKGVPAAPKARQARSKAPRLATQPAVRQQRAAPRAAASSRPARRGAARPNQYAKQRPGARAQAAPAGNRRRPSKPVQFPSRPARRPATAARPSAPSAPAQARPAGPASAQRPVVFYPKQNRRKPRRAPAAAARPANPPTDSSPSRREPRKRKHHAGLRPEEPTSTQRPSNATQVNIVNQPTVINNQTTNITHNRTNVNQWFRNNTWRRRVAINSRHWNGRPWWYRPDYGNWHHGHWHGRHYFRGRNAWRHVDSDDHAWLTGLVAWGLGNLIYRSGYQVYSNPYYVRPVVIGSTTINYSLPISVQKSDYELAYADDEDRAQELLDRATSHFDRARRAFYSGDTSEAYDEINRAIALVPDDTSMHEFRALVLFSAARYREAAEVMHAVLAVAPGWDWTTLSGLYPDHDDYTAQLRALERYVRLNPRQADVRFLLAYHYITIGAPDSAQDQLQTALTLNPDDRLSADLLSLLKEQNEDEDDERPTPAGDGVLRAADLEGDWKAGRRDAEIELDLKDETFTWHFAQSDQRLSGRYAVTQDLLLLASEDGSQMVGTVGVKDRDRFTFRLLGSSDSDEGLEFVRR